MPPCVHLWEVLRQGMRRSGNATSDLLGIRKLFSKLYFVKPFIREILLLHNVITLGMLDFICVYFLPT